MTKRKKLTMGMARKLVWGRAAALLATDLEPSGAWDALAAALGLDDEDYELTPEEEATYRKANDEVTKAIADRHLGGVLPLTVMR